MQQYYLQAWGVPVPNSASAKLNSLHKCNHEEADTRLFLHVLDVSTNRCTDIVIIALYHFFDLNVTDLWVEIGEGQNRRWLPIHLYVMHLGEEVFHALKFQFPFTQRRVDSASG